MKQLIFFLACFFLMLQLGAQTNPIYSKVKIDLHGKSMKELAATGVAVDHGKYQKGEYFIAELSSDELAILKTNGFHYEVLIKDVTKYYQENHRKPVSKKKERSTSCFDDQIYTTPNGFVYGTMGDYYTYQELLDQMDSLAVKYPNIVKARTAIDTFHSIEGRSIYWMKISDNPNVDETETEVLHTGLHHAREPMGAMQLIFYMNYLCEHYNTDPEVKYIVDHSEQYFVPLVNPDGYLFNQTTNPGGGGMWRKNRRHNADGSYGVDLNRNYGYQWGYDNIGSSPTTTSQTYRGTAGFSEPEIQAIKYFCENHSFAFALNNHSYGNLLIYPWGYSDMSTQDSLTFITNSKEESNYNRFRYGTGTETVNYTTNGDSDDWMYGEQTTKNKIFSMTPEAGSDIDGFWPPFSEILPQCNDNMHLNMNYMRCALAYATLDPVHDNFLKSVNSYSKFVINNIGMDSNATFTVSINPITTNITAGTPIIYSGMPRYVNVLDSIPITLASGIQHGDIVKYIISINNGYVTYNDTVTSYFATQINKPFESDCNSLSQWTATSTWNTNSDYFISPTSSLTETPIGKSQNNTLYTLATANSINLANTLHARLTYNARWITECEYDFVQAQVSINNGTTYSPLCTRKSMRSRNTSIYDDPAMDGFQLQWNFDEASLDDYLGKTIKLRFYFETDGGITKDGFYVEDVLVETIPINPTSVTDISSFETSLLYPNPVLNSATLRVPTTEDFTWNISDMLGQTLLKGEGNQHEVSINLNSVPHGIYIIEVHLASGSTLIQKFVKE